MFALFQVFFLGAAIASTNSLVVSVVEWVSVFPGAVGGVFNKLGFLLGEGQVGTVGGEVGVESTALFHDVVERLVTVQDLAVLLGVFSTGLVLGALERLVVVSNLVQVGERFGCNCREETGEGLGVWAWGRTVVHVLKFGSLDEFLRATVSEGLGTGRLALAAHGSVDVTSTRASRASLSQVVLASIHVRVSNGVTLQLFEGVLWLATWVDDHFLIGTNFMAFLTCRQTMSDLKVETAGYKKSWTNSSRKKKKSVKSEYLR